RNNSHNNGNPNQQLNQDPLHIVLKEIAKAFKDATFEVQDSLWLSVTELSTLEDAIISTHKIEAEKYYNRKNREKA
ncbi:8584_t:CDS:2, partial [Cetraspora pellucida]